MKKHKCSTFAVTETHTYTHTDTHTHTIAALEELIFDSGAMTKCVFNSHTPVLDSKCKHVKKNIHTDRHTA